MPKKIKALDIKNRILLFLSRFKLIPTPLFITYAPVGYKIKAKEIRKIVKIIKTGDILLRGYVGYINNFLIPGFFSHAGLVVDENSIIHAVADVTEKADIIDFCRCDYLAVIRPNFDPKNDLEIKAKAVSRAHKFIGTPYDFDFDFSNMDHHKLCCTELIYYIYEEYKNYLNLFPRYKKLSFGSMKYIIAPDDIFFLTKNMTIMYISDEAKKKLRNRF